MRKVGKDEKFRKKMKNMRIGLGWKLGLLCFIKLLCIFIKML